MNELLEILPEWLREEAKDIVPDEWFDLTGVMAMVGFKPSPDLHSVVMQDRTDLGFHIPACIPYPTQGISRV